jgi:hypothetical protein
LLRCLLNVLRQRDIEVAGRTLRLEDAKEDLGVPEALDNSGTTAPCQPTKEGKRSNFHILTRCIVDYNLARSRNGITLGYDFILILILPPPYQIVAPDCPYAECSVHRP